MRNGKRGEQRERDDLGSGGLWVEDRTKDYLWFQRMPGTFFLSTSVFFPSSFQCQYACIQEELLLDWLKSEFSSSHHLTFGVILLLFSMTPFSFPCVLTFKNVVLLWLIISSESFHFVIIFGQVKMNKRYNCWSPEWMRKRASLGCPPWIPDTKYNSLRSWSTLVQIQTAETTPFTCELGSLLEASDSWVFWQK